MKGRKGGVRRKKGGGVRRVVEWCRKKKHRDKRRGGWKGQNACLLSPCVGWELHPL